MVHALVPGDNVGVRGPIATFALDPEAYDTVVMVSTGTAVAPFLQLLAKTPVESTSTRFRLLHAAPPRDPDWSTEFVAPLQQRWGSRLAVDRIQPGKIQRDDIARALDGAGRVLVMVCLPPNVMRPFCGPLTPTLEQGPLTGLLSDMGLQRNQVWKLE
jgi:cytochrome-b5 reductase